jgi:hypothetical protein
MSTADNSDRRDVRLEDTSERWEKREGYLTRLCLSWSGSATTSTHLTAEDLQEIVNAAARQYRITPECICPPDPYPVDQACVIHGEDPS